MKGKFRSVWRVGVALVLAVSLSLVMAVPVSAGDPTVALTTPGGGIDDLIGVPTGSGTEAGEHSIEVTDATSSNLTGTDAEGTTDNVSFTLDGTEVLTLTIGGTEVTTDNLSAATADMTPLITVASDIQDKINAATTDPDVDVTVTVEGTSPDRYFLITVDLAGLSNSISSNVTSSGAEPACLINIEPVAGTDAKAVDTFTAETGSNGLWQADPNYGDNSTTMTIADSSPAGTASTLLGLETLVEVADAFIEGITLDASTALEVGIAVVTVTEGGASYLEVTGNATMDRGADNELTVTAYDSAGNQATSYNGTKNLTFSGPAVAPDGTAPTVEEENVGTVIEVVFTDGASGGTAATLVAQKVESTTVDVSDGTIDSFADPDYDLDLTVNGMNLNKAFYTASEVVFVTVGDSALDGDPMAIDTIIISANSTLDQVGDANIILTETASDTEIFEGTFTLISVPPADREANQIVVEEGNTVTVDYDATYIETATIDETGPEYTDNTTADAAYYKDGGTIILTVNLDAVGHTVTADFSEIDSEYTAEAVEVVDNKNNTYTVTYDIDADNTVADGAHIISVAAEDAAGNPAIAGDYTPSVSVYLDNTGPAVDDAEADPELVQPITPTPVTFSANVTDVGVGVDTVTIDLLSINGSATQVMTLVSGLYTYECADLSVTAEGTYVLTITATDALGNSDNASAITLEVIADDTPPVFVSTAVEYPVGYESAREGDQVVITAVVTDNLTDVETVTIDAEDIGLGATETLALTGADTYSATLTVQAGTTVGIKTLTITATDSAANAATANVTVEVVLSLTGYNIDLVEGWNLISLPLIPDTDNISAILASISDNVNIVWGNYDPTTGLFQSYDPTQEVNDLTVMTAGKGYWVDMTVDATLTISGVELPAPPSAPPTYKVYEGWNLIGFKSVDEVGIAEYLGSVEESLEAIYGYDAAAGVYFIPGFTAGHLFLEPGYGYWLAVSAAGTIYP